MVVIKLCAFVKIHKMLPFNTTDFQKKGKGKSRQHKVLTRMSNNWSSQTIKKKRKKRAATNYTNTLVQWHLKKIYLC